jgi:HTH-type transcriptional regulator / antitoxin HigA
MTDRAPAEAFHPSEFIREEMDARGWVVHDLALFMGGDYAANYLAMDLYLKIGPEQPGIRLGGVEVALARAFDVDAAFFSNLEYAWLNHVARTDGETLKETKP